jgi:hypothetical protein
MKTTIPSILAAMAAGLLTGCETTGISPREHSGVSYPSYVLSLQPDPTNAPVSKLATPIRLAVVQIGESAPPSALLDKLAGQKALLASVVGLPLPGEPDDSSYQRRAYVSTEDYANRTKKICSLARMAGADYVLLFGGNIDSWVNNNALCALDITIIGGLILPGSEINLEGKGAGVVIEAATGNPVCFLNADTKRSGLSPDFLVDGKTTDLRAQVRDALVGKLGDELLKTLAAAGTSSGTTLH